MRHLKTFSLAMMATACLVFAANASAAVTTSPSGTDYTGTFTATASETLTMKAGAFTKTCTESTISGTVTLNTTIAGIGISTLSYGNCGSVTVDTLSKGSLKIASGGAVSITGDEVTTSTLGTSCVYGGSTGTALGTLKGGTTATLTISASLPKISGGFLCANPASYSGKYTVTTPDTLLVD